MAQLRSLIWKIERLRILDVCSGNVTVKADLQPALKALKDRMMRKNAAEEIAQKLCESVAASLRGYGGGYQYDSRRSCACLWGLHPVLQSLTVLVIQCLGSKRENKLNKAIKQILKTVEQLKDLKSALRAFEEVLL